MLSSIIQQILAAIDAKITIPNAPVAPVLFFKAHNEPRNISPKTVTEVQRKTNDAYSAV